MQYSKPVSKRVRCLSVLTALFTLTMMCALATASDPVLVGQWPGWRRGPALGVAVSGNHVYVATANGGLQVIDVSNPANCVRVGGYDTTGAAYDVAVNGQYAYVADGDQSDLGLQVIDVSNPANCSLVGGYRISGEAQSVAVVGDYAYVADYGTGLRVIDITDPGQPRARGRLRHHRDRKRCVGDRELCLHGRPQLRSTGH